MKNNHQPSNFELQQEIKRLANNIFFSKNVEELKQNEKPPMGEIVCFWILVIFFLGCLFIVLMYSTQMGIVKLCTTMMPVLSFFIGLIIPDLRHKL